MAGKFITFEGVDGSGKTTQAKLLAKKLYDLGHDVLLTREPGGSKFAEDVRTLVLRKDINIDSITEAFLMSAARRDHWLTVIKPHLDAGGVVISDRFFDSMLVYQGKEFNSPTFNTIQKLIDLSVPGVHPDLTIVFTIDPVIALERLQNRAEVINRFDSEKLEEISKRDALYKLLAGFSQFRSAIITDNGYPSPESIAEEVVLPLVLSNI